VKMAGRDAGRLALLGAALNEAFFSNPFIDLFGEPLTEGHDLPTSLCEAMLRDWIEIEKSIDDACMASVSDDLVIHM